MRLLKVMTGVIKRVGVTPVHSADATRGVPIDLDAFCQREHPRLVGALSLFCGDGDLAEELAQDALERACQKWPQVRTMDSPGAWVHRVALNLARSRFRRRAAERRAHARSGLSDQTHDDHDVAGAVAMRRELATLTERQRAVLVLRFYLGFDVAQTAELLSITSAAVKAATHRGLARLRDEFAADHEETRRAR